MIQDTRWMGVGRSTARDSRAAGTQAAAAALRGTDPRLLVVFAAIEHDLTALLAGIREAAGDVPLIGCSTHGEIGPGGPRDGSVIVTALGGSGFSVTIARAEAISGRQRIAGIELAATVGDPAASPDHPHQALMLFTDGLARDQEEVLRGIYEVFGASVPVFGGAAGDGWQRKQTYQLFGDASGDQVLTDGAVVALLRSQAPLSIAASHGWYQSGEPMVVTASGDGRVFELDDRPALDVLLERLGAPAEIYHDGAALAGYLLPRPLGVERRSGLEVRNMSTEVDVEGRTIGGCGALGLGALTWAMCGDTESILKSVDLAFQQVHAGLDGRTPVGLLTLSCAATRAVLEQAGIEREGDLIAGHAGDAPFAGFYTYGEIARTRGIDGFHNQTLVVLAVG